MEQIKLRDSISRVELFQFFTEEELEKEYLPWVCGGLRMWAFRKMEYESLMYAKTILPQLKSQRGGGRNQIVCQGNNYSWMGTWISLKSSCDRTAKFKPVLYIIAEACFEYWAYGGDSWENLKFERVTWQRAKEILGVEITEKTWAITCNSDFFPR